MVTLTLSDEDAKLWLKVMRENETRLGKPQADSPSARMKEQLECALLDGCSCGEGSYTDT